jgi:dUTP pyrophosphatase
MVNNSIKILFKKLHKDAKIPEYKCFGDAGCDLYSIEDTVLKPGERKLIGTGVSIELPQKNIEAQIRPRSGLAFKYGITVLNSPGTIDFGYHDEIKVIMINHGHEDYFIKKGDRFAQMVFSEVYNGVFIKTFEFTDSERGFGGLGHTGV